MIKSTGEVSPFEADDANIPVSIFISQLNDAEDETTIQAENAIIYCPTCNLPVDEERGAAEDHHAFVDPAYGSAVYASYDKEPLAEHGDLKFDPPLPICPGSGKPTETVLPTWQMTADCYQPRRESVISGAFNVFATSREELSELVRNAVLPLYKIALTRIEGIAAGTDDSLYYWKVQEED